LLGRKLTEQGFEFAALGAGVRGEIEPNESLGEIDGNAAPLRVGEAEIVLGDGVAGFGLLAEGRQGGRQGGVFGGTDGER
jgi:hypothetical protein